MQSLGSRQGPGGSDWGLQPSLWKAAHRRYIAIGKSELYSTTAGSFFSAAKARARRAKESKAGSRRAMGRLRGVKLAARNTTMKVERGGRGREF